MPREGSRVTRWLSLFPSLALTATLFAGAVRAEAPPLVPRNVFFSNPEKISPQISPDGTRIAYLAPDEGVLNVWVRTVGKTDDHPVTKDRERPIYTFNWQGDSKHVLHVQDKGGDENYHVYQTDVDTRAAKDLTPYDSIRAQIVAVDPSRPNEMLVGLNIKDKRLHDVYRIDLTTGKATLDTQNPGDVAGWTADNQFHVRVAQVTLPDGGTEIRVRDNASADWKKIRVESASETFGGVIGFTPDDRKAWLISSVDANAARLLEMDPTTGKTTVLAEDPQYDVNGVMTHPKTHELEAIQFVRARKEWQFTSKERKADYATLAKVRDGDIAVTSRDLADKNWVVEYTMSDGPLYYYLYNRDKKATTFLFTHRPKLEQYKLSKMEPIEFKARDGRTIHGYLTLPAGAEPKHLPLVLDVHGGPWARDTWGYNREVQWLANRGYAVLQINFRGSTGYGKDFLNAGDRQWAGTMQTDLLDGKKWAIDKGYADPAKVAIFGGSYGGYATLAGLAFTPTEFACGVDQFGPSNLLTLLASIPPYWEPIIATFKKRMGDPATDKAMLEARSPLFKAEAIQSPLLIAQGANDVRVKQAESDQIVAAMRKGGKPVEYLVFPDEGHGFARPENNLKFYAAAEAFLAKYLGGRAEPAGPGEEVSALQH